MTTALTCLENLPSFAHPTHQQRTPILQSFNQRKVKHPFKPYVSTRDTTSGVVVHTCPTPLLVRNLQQKKLQDQEQKAEKKAAFLAQVHKHHHNMAKPNLNATATAANSANYQQSWSQANVRRQAMTVSVQTTSATNQGTTSATTTGTGPTTAATATQPTTDTPAALPAPARANPSAATPSITRPSAVATASTNPLPAVQSALTNSSVGPSANSALALNLLRKNRPMHRTMQQTTTTTTSGAQPTGPAAVTNARQPTTASNTDRPLISQVRVTRPISTSALHQSGRQTQIQVTELVRHKRPRPLISAPTAAEVPHSADQENVPNPDKLANPIIEVTSSPTSNKRQRRSSPAASPSRSPPIQSSTNPIRSPPSNSRGRQHLGVAQLRSPARAPTSAAAAAAARSSSPTPSLAESLASAPSRVSSAYRSLAPALSQPLNKIPTTSLAHGRFGTVAGGNSAYLPTPSILRPTPGAILLANKAATQKAEFEAQHPNLRTTQPTSSTTAANASNLSSDNFRTSRYAQLLRIQKERDQRRQAETARAIEQEQQLRASAGEAKRTIFQADEDEPMASDEQPNATAASTSSRANNESTSSSADAMVDCLLTPPRSTPLASPSQLQPGLVPSKRKARPTPAAAAATLKRPAPTEAEEADEETMDKDIDLDHTETNSPSTTTRVTRSGRKRMKRE